MEHIEISSPLLEELIIPGGCCPNRGGVGGGVWRRRMGSLRIEILGYFSPPELREQITLWIS